jgi:hypothetical protein
MADKFRRCGSHGRRAGALPPRAEQKAAPFPTSAGKITGVGWTFVGHVNNVNNFF